MPVIPIINITDWKLVYDDSGVTSNNDGALVCVLSDVVFVVVVVDDDGVVERGWNAGACNEASPNGDVADDVDDEDTGL